MLAAWQVVMVLQALRLALMALNLGAIHLGS